MSVSLNDATGIAFRCHAGGDCTPPFLLVAELPADDDPPPVPPVRPGQDDCCRGSCDTCVFDLYEQASERYRAELDAWQQRTSAREKDVGRPTGA